MLTQLSTVKARLGIDPFDVKDDALLIRAINAISARFDRETNRRLARTVYAAHEFNAFYRHLSPACFPIETVLRFDRKTNEVEGWVEQSPVYYRIQSNCVIVLSGHLGTFWQTGRVLYTGGYVLPGNPVSEGQTPLPADLEMAAIEMVAFWYQNRDRVGVLRLWPKGGFTRSSPTLT